MCRLLLVKSKSEFEPVSYLQEFASISKNSKEFQGHGWGMSYITGSGSWINYKNIKPIWEDALGIFPKTKFIIAHARSAFQDKDIIIENNMPFYDDNYIFIFNGELHGVRIREEGRIGAEKIFNFLKRIAGESMKENFAKAVSLLNKRTKYVKAMNIIIVDKNNGDIFLSSDFGEEEDENYFTMSYKETEDDLIICSQKFKDNAGWVSLNNHSVKIW